MCCLSLPWVLVLVLNLQRLLLALRSARCKAPAKRGACRAQRQPGRPRPTCSGVQTGPPTRPSVALSHPVSGASQARSPGAAAAPDRAPSALPFASWATARVKARCPCSAIALRRAACCAVQQAAPAATECSRPPHPCLWPRPALSPLVVSGPSRLSPTPAHCDRIEGTNRPSEAASAPFYTSAAERSLGCKTQAVGFGENQNAMTAALMLSSERARSAASHSSAAASPK